MTLWNMIAMEFLLSPFWLERVGIGCSMSLEMVVALHFQGNDYSGFRDWFRVVLGFRV